MNLKLTLIAALAFGLSAPAFAGNTLIAPGKKVLVAKSTLAVTPAGEWNKLGARPGSKGEIWTLDGDDLNKVTFYGGIMNGQALFREVNKRERPLPKLSSTMLVTDIPAFLESSYRVALGTSLITIDSMEPVQFAGKPGVRFTYSFVVQNEDLLRKGEARAAMIGGKLYMIGYEAPALHYFDRNIAGYRQIADSAGF